MKRSIYLICPLFLTSCYPLRGYDVGVTGGKQFYNDYNNGVAGNAYWTGTANVVLHFERSEKK
jgi:hypothetical protein